MKTFIIFVLLAMVMSIASATRQLSLRGKELQTPQEQFPIPTIPQQQLFGSDVISISGR
uniref:Fast omega gliadin n=1 Tax=Aegilops tauschii TaxID=37682 RepID=A0A0N7FRH6_AEGTA|nr:fast omega gliadin [Aegilops tauschii]